METLLLEILRHNEVDMYQPSPGTFVVRVWQEGDPVVEQQASTLQRAVGLAYIAWMKWKHELEQEV